MRRKVTFILLGATALAAAIFLPQVFTQRQQAADGSAPTTPPGSARPGGARGAPVKVLVHRVKPRTLAETITATGTVLANESVELRSEISGKVVEIGFEEGARVKKGDVLLKINDSELQAQLRQTLHRTELAKIRLDRQRQLLDQGGTAQDAFDSAANEAQVLEAEADLIRAQLEKTQILAPFSGMIGLRMVSEGSYLTPSAPIASLQDIDQLKIDFTVSERHMERLQVGTPITFTVADGIRQYTGEIYAIEPAIDRDTRMILLRARSGNTSGRLLPGAFADVEVVLEKIENALLVPTSAIVPGLNQRSLFVFEDGKAALRMVETGIRLDREIQITSGLEPDAVVITTGLLMLRDGTPVELLDTE
jgi:membrane fusion protein (multidrug efflux system)